MSRCLLSQTQTYQLLRWLDTEPMRARLMETTDDVMAAEVMKALGFPISPGNILGVRRTLGLRKRAEPAPAKPSADLAALEELLAEQAGKINALEHNVQVLLDRVHTLEKTPRRQ